MNFQTAIKRQVSEAKHLLEKAEDLQTKYETAKEFTQTFLNECDNAGIETVCIGVKNKAVEASVKWPYGGEGNVFAMGRKDGWPAIWGVVEKLGIGDGCGNTDQHQAITSNLVDGTYQLKDGAWAKLKDDF
jgi:hypothetical protein